MTSHWGQDQEERSAVAKKSHDAYAAARQAISKVEAAEASAARAMLLVQELTDIVRQQRSDLDKALVSIASLQQQFIDATEPAPPKRKKAA